MYGEGLYRKTLALLAAFSAPATGRGIENFDERNIFSFAALPDGKGWALSRGALSRDAVMINGFRPQP